MLVSPLFQKYHSTEEAEAAEGPSDESGVSSLESLLGVKVKYIQSLCVMFALLGLKIKSVYLL